MNKNVRIKVKTPVGVTKSEEVGDLVAQGTVEAVVISGVSIDNGVNDAFVDSDGEVEYFGVKLHPTLFMDDIGRMAETVESAQDGNKRMEDLLESKCLNFNLSKSNYIIMGKSKQKKKLRDELEKNPLTLCNEPMSEVTSLKYLGDFLGSTLESSVHQTVLKRVGIVKKSIHDIRAIIEDQRASSVGGFNVAIQIWESAILPMFLNNAEAWFQISKKTVKILDDTFNTFYRCMFRIGTGCPKVNFYWQCATLTPMNHILQKKLMFIYHLANLPISSLAKNVFELQLDNTCGIVAENAEHLNALNFSVNRFQSKAIWRKIVRNYVLNRNKAQLLESMKKYKKINYDECVQEEFRRKPYFYEMTLDQIRTRFRISSQMLQSVKANFASKYRHKSLACESCRGTDRQTDSLTPRPENEPIDSQTHLLTSCPAFDDLREQYDTQSDLGLVNFFRAVIDRRIEMGEY